MARTWNLVTTLALGASRIINDRGDLAVSANVLYFYDKLSGGNGSKVWSWDGSTLTDISGSTFPGNLNAIGKGIVVFNNEVYFLWFDPSLTANSRQRVFKYDGSGQNWTEVYALTNGGTSGTVLKMAADTSRIAIVVRDATGNYHLVASTDGATWTEQTVDVLSAGDVGEIGFMFGDEHYTGYTEILAYSFVYDEVISHSSGVNWALLGGAGFSVTFASYADGYSFHGDPNGGTLWELGRSTNWGATITNPSTALDDGSLAPNVYSISAGAIMYCTRVDTQAWTYNGTAFIADGTIATGSLLAFFELNGVLYALGSDNKVYSADSSGLFYSQGGIPGAILI